MLAALLALALTGCSSQEREHSTDEQGEWLKPTVKVAPDMRWCGTPGGPVVVGESLLFIGQLGGGGWGVDHLREVELEWSVDQPSPGPDQPGLAVVRRHPLGALVVGIRPGVVLVSARYRGVVGTFPLTVVARLREPLLASRRVTARTGDTVEVQAHVAPELRDSTHWVEFRQEGSPHLVAEYASTVYSIDGWQRKIVGTRPGAVTVFACYKGWRDSTVIHFEGPPPPQHGDVPPTPTPAETTVVAGLEMGLRAWHLNEHPGNGRRR